MHIKDVVTRRGFLKLSAGGAAVLAGLRGWPFGGAPAQADDPKPHGGMHHGGVMPESPGQTGFTTDENDTHDPARILTEFDMGKVSVLPDGRTMREYEISSYDREIEVAKGVTFPAWTYNGRVPGPTIRCTEGDVVRIRFTNAGSMPHTIHFHGIHPAGMDGVEEIVERGGTFTYEFEAQPFGLHLYHCHVMPLKRHIHKGLYGTFIIDPKAGRLPAKELVMVMNGFDTDQDGANEFYTVNGKAFFYQDHPINLKVDEMVRIYLVNMTEFDLINSFHLHAQMFHYYPVGTSLTPAEYNDNIMLAQGQRGILEFSYHTPGRFMFHAHQSEFAELGWMGMFNVTR